MSKNAESSATLETLKNFDSLPDSAYVREPVVATLFACSRATVWNYVKAGKLPQPKKLGPRHTVWCVGELRPLLGGAA